MFSFKLLTSKRQMSRCLTVFGLICCDAHFSLTKSQLVLLLFHLRLEEFTQLPFFHFRNNWKSFFSLDCGIICLGRLWHYLTTLIVLGTLDTKFIVNTREFILKFNRKLYRNPDNDSSWRIFFKFTRRNDVKTKIIE